MRQTSWSSVVAAFVAVALLIVSGASMAGTLSCPVGMDQCQTGASIAFQRCSMLCTRYDTECFDRCDDVHDVAVRHCMITSTLCEAASRHETSGPHWVTNHKTQ